MQDEDTPPAEPKTNARHARRVHARSRSTAERRVARAKHHGRAGKGLVPTLVLATLVMFLGGMMLTGRALPLPAALSESISQSVSARLPDGAVDIGSMSVTLGRDGAPRVRMSDVSFGDTSGAGVAVLNGLSARLSPGALLQGRLVAERVRLDGAQVTLRRAADGTFAFRGADGATGSTQSVTSVLAGLDAVLTRGPISTLQEVTAERVVIALEDARTGRIWQATNATMRLRRSAGELNLSVTSDVFNGTDNVAEVQGSFSYDISTGDVGLGLRLVDVPAADIAVQSPALAWLGVLDAPISGSVRAEYQPNVGLSRLSGALDIAQGALSPDGGGEPIGFDQARAYFAFDPALQKIEFTDIAVQSATLRAAASGHMYLTELGGGWPEAFVGQMLVGDLSIDRSDLFQETLFVEDVRADLRLRLDPFSVELAQAVVSHEGAVVRAKGAVSAAAAGWTIALDAQSEAVNSETVMTFWPLIEAPVTRSWLQRNLQTGQLRDVTAAFRKVPGSKSDLGLTFEFSDGEVQFLRDMPRMTEASGRAVMHAKTFDLVVTSGIVAAETGDLIDVAGSTFRVPDIEQKPASGDITIRARGLIPALLSVTNNRPLRLMERAGRDINLAEGFGDVTARVLVPLKNGIAGDEVDYQVTAELSDLSSDVIVPGRVLTSRRMALAASPQEVRVTGPARLDGVALTADWRQPLGEGARAAGSRITGEIAIGPQTVEAFELPLPDDLIRGETQAGYALTVKPGAAPELSLTSDLQGLGLRLAAIGWEKSPSTGGGLELEASLGAVPEVRRLSLSAPGLGLDGRLTLTDTGSLGAAVFDQVRVGGWLDAGVRLTPRGPGQSPAIAIENGSFDFRSFPRAQIGQSGGARAPISVSLDRFILSDTITFAPLQGSIDAGQAGLSGAFEARINGQTPVRGTLAPANGGTAIRLQADDAGGVVRATGLSDNASGGALDLVLTPDISAGPGAFRGEFLVEDIRVKNAPVMAALLDAISVVGLIDQLSGQGIRFGTVDGRFRLTPDVFVLDEAAAIGGSLGISAAGRYDLAGKVIDMQGVVSPVYFLNAVGSVVSRRGEGLFGFNYRVSGPADGPTVSVNPLSILTPGLFREIFRRPAPTN